MKEAWLTGYAMHELNNVFSELKQSLESSKEVKINNFGLSRTPYLQLLNEEKARKSVTKRKDFIELLNREK